MKHLLTFFYHFGFIQIIEGRPTSTEKGNIEVNLNSKRKMFVVRKYWHKRDFAFKIPDN